MDLLWCNNYQFTKMPLCQETCLVISREVKKCQVQIPHHSYTSRAYRWEVGGVEPTIIFLVSCWFHHLRPVMELGESTMGCRLIPLGVYNVMLQSPIITLTIFSHYTELLCESIARSGRRELKRGKAHGTKKIYRAEFGVQRLGSSFWVMHSMHAEQHLFHLGCDRVRDGKS